MSGLDHGAEMSKSAVLYASIYAAMLLVNVSVYATDACKTRLPWTILNSDDDRFSIASLFETVGKILYIASYFKGLKY